MVKGDRGESLQGPHVGDKVIMISTSEELLPARVNNPDQSGQTAALH